MQMIKTKVIKSQLKSWMSKLTIIHKVYHTVRFKDKMENNFKYIILMMVSSVYFTLEIEKTKT